MFRRKSKILKESAATAKALKENAVAAPAKVSAQRPSLVPQASDRSIGSHGSKGSCVREGVSLDVCP